MVLMDFGDSMIIYAFWKFVRNYFCFCHFKLSVKQNSFNLFVCSKIKINEILNLEMNIQRNLKWH